jgi:hypothetical protein
MAQFTRQPEFGNQAELVSHQLLQECAASPHDDTFKAIFHCSRSARAGGAGFENLLTRA